MSEKAHILVIDDEKNYLLVLQTLLEDEGYTVTAISDPETALAFLEESEVDAVVTDMKMPRVSGRQVLERVKKNWPYIPVLIMTAFGSIESAVEVMKYGAFDYITKPFSNDELLLSIHNAVELSRAHRQYRLLQEVMEDRYGVHKIVGRSKAIRDVLLMVERAAPSRSTVLITGESGTGKELVARAIHYTSPRKDKPFISVNCMALNPGVLESELFGHEKGSFTGATSQKIGYFEMANGGTLFIDEVGEMPLSMQVKLLRVLQNQRFMRVGGTAEIISRFRLVAATNRDLRDEVAKGRFREDLFYRLSVVPLRVPPLRERREDIIGLAEAFAESYCQRYGRPSLRLTDAERACLLNYSWPGNVRELKNIIERAVILNAPLLELVSPSRATASGSGAGAFIIPDFPTIPELEERYLRYVLERTGGKVCGPDGAESLLHLKRSTIYLKLKKYGIIPSDFI